MVVWVFDRLSCIHPFVEGDTLLHAMHMATFEAVPIKTSFAVLIEVPCQSRHLGDARRWRLDGGIKYYVTVMKQLESMLNIVSTIVAGTEVVDHSLMYHMYLCTSFCFKTSDRTSRSAACSIKSSHAPYIRLRCGGRAPPDD